MVLLTGTNDPIRFGYLEALPCKGLKVPGFIALLPREGTESLFTWGGGGENRFIALLPREGTERIKKNKNITVNAFIALLPREGTESHRKEQVVPIPLLVHCSTSPRGDGKKLHCASSG